VLSRKLLFFAMLGLIPLKLRMDRHLNEIHGHLDVFVNAGTRFDRETRQQADSEEIRHPMMRYRMRDMGLEGVTKCIKKTGGNAVGLHVDVSLDATSQ
jgi:hypothetical protein